MAERRSTDASKLSFPLQLVILIVSCVIAGVTAQYAGQSAARESQGKIREDQAQIRSDVRDILTRMDLTRDTQKAQSQAQEERINSLKVSIDAAQLSMKGSIDALSRRQEMQQIQIGELAAAIAKLPQGRK
jgi:hypothetical protein